MKETLEEKSIEAIIQKIRTFEKISFSQGALVFKYYQELMEEKFIDLASRVNDPSLINELQINTEVYAFLIGPYGFSAVLNHLPSQPKTISKINFLGNIFDVKIKIDVTFEEKFRFIIKN